MWLRLLLLPFLLSGAQNHSWIFSLQPQPQKSGNSIADSTDYLNRRLGAPQSSTLPPFSLNILTRASSWCTTTDNKDGKCVKPSLCSLELPERDPTTQFDFRELGCHYLLQCCPLDQIKNETPKKPNMLPPGCGWTNPGGYRLRTSDSYTTGFSDFADFPWMVALLKKSHNPKWTQDYIGGGTLIHPSVVLTVAHKVDTKGPEEIKCRAGEWDAMSEDEIYPHQDRDVRKISIHESYLRLRAHHDAALLFLDTPFKVKDVYHIGVACLARDMPAPGTLCYSMGWGRSPNDTKYVKLLKKIELPLVEPETCQRQLRNTWMGSNFLLHHTLTCAGGEAGRGTCIGDGGASLVCPLPGDTTLKRYAVYGMVAFGLGCGVKDVPGVYVNVPVMLNWINREMDGEQLETTGYFSYEESYSQSGFSLGMWEKPNLLDYY